MKTLNVVAAIIKKDNKILATKRGYGEFINMWEFPGGKIEPNETKEEALIREIKEKWYVQALYKASVRYNSFLACAYYIVSATFAYSHFGTC